MATSKKRRRKKKNMVPARRRRKKERKGKWGRKIKMSGQKSSLKIRKDNKIMQLPKYP